MNQLISLYDFLGRGAGPELGAQVYFYFRSKYPDLTIGKRYISNPKYEGFVYLYPKWFLEQYFNKNNENENENKLPF